MRNSNTVMEGFLDYCRGVKKLKHSSVKDVKCSLGKVQKYIDDRKLSLEVWELELEHFIQYVGFLRDMEERGSGISKQLSHIRGYLDYCWKVGRAHKNPLDKFDVKDNSPMYVSRVLTVDEITSLLKVLSKKTRVERKERLIVLILYGLGLRTSELCHLKVKDISVEHQDVFIKGKFDIERRIPIPDSVWIEILAYLQENNLKNNYMFRTEFKKRKLGINDVSAIVKKYAEKAKLDGLITAKVFRHTFASHLMDQGVDIAVISSLMGHKSPTQTGVYLHAFEKTKQHAIVSMEPIISEEK